jgi:hypothetical protein
MTDDFESSRSDQPDHGDDISPKKTRSKVLDLKRIRRDCRLALDQALGKVSERATFTQEDVRTAVDGVVDKLDLNDYKRDIAQRIATSIVRERNSAFGEAMHLWTAGQFDLFTAELAQRVWLPLDKGSQVSLANATWAHLQHKLGQERADIDEKLAAYLRNESTFEMVRPLMERDPLCTVTAAMQKLGHWTQQQAAA